MGGIAGIMTADGAAPDVVQLRALAQATARRGRRGIRQSISGGVGLVEAVPAIGQTGNEPKSARDGMTLVIDASPHCQADVHEIGDGPRSRQGSPLDGGNNASFLEDLRGGFASALIDPSDGGLALARDGFGIKTLYYAESSAGFAFASEIGALLDAGLVTRGIVGEPRDELLQMQFCTGRQTIFPDVQRVLPGESLSVYSGRIVSRRRRSMLPEGGPAAWTEAQALERLDRALDESLTAGLPDGEPFSILLSGGIDSAVLMAALARQGRLPDQALTAYRRDTGTMDDDAELEFARGQARRLGVPLTETGYGEDEFWQHLPDLVDMLDDPTADHRVLPLYLLAEKAAETSGTVLLGDGGDELFAGYGRHRGVVRPWYLGGPKIIRPRGQFDRLDILRRQPAAWRDGIRAAESLENHRDCSKLQVAQAVDCADWLPNDVLLKLDRCLSRYGLDGRFPLLDRSVASLAFALPDGLKVRRGRGKYLLRRWLELAEPQAEPFARKRRAASPLGTWLFRHGERLGPLVARQPGVEEVARPDRVKTLFQSGGRREAFAAWSLLFYALWHRRHVLGLAAAGDTFETLAADR